MGTENHAEWVDAVTNPETVRAVLEDYRAGLGIDADDEGAECSAGRTVQCPTLVLSSAHDDLEDLHGNPLSIWEPWCENVTGWAVDSGHHVAEDNPDELAHALMRFLD